MLSRLVAFGRKSSLSLRDRFPRLFGRKSYRAFMRDEIAAVLGRERAQRILEVGGIDRPMLSKSPGRYEYVGLDIEWRQDCSLVYDEFLVQSVCDEIPLKADLVFSITVLEHVDSNVQSVKRMYDALNAGGAMIHYIPSKWHPYSMLLRLVGPRGQKALIRWFRPGAASVTGYPAFFDRCSPAEMSALFEKAGLTDVKVKAFFGAADYFAAFPPLYVLVSLAEKVMEGLNARLFCSGFVISAAKT